MISPRVLSTAPEAVGRQEQARSAVCVLWESSPSHRMPVCLSCWLTVSSLTHLISEAEAPVWSRGVQNPESNYAFLVSKAPSSYTSWFLCLVLVGFPRGLACGWDGVIVIWGSADHFSCVYRSQGSCFPERNFLVSGDFILFIIVMDVYVGHAHHSTHVEVRGQLSRDGSLLPP